MTYKKGLLASAALAVSIISMASLAQDKTYSLSDVTQHATEDDCWMAIEGKVYDLTAYISEHPAGASTMVTWCGSEATDGMRTKGLGDDHSSEAWEELEKYLIGTVK